ncbi:general stress protein [Aspergillus alliaceus]|uniref:general stress protein n=1 Tax=Petromyces alliaceus TaxID=209559 RepID=UPI0012A4C8A9|nr:uncharacterized protein BDW43DRAFT_310593 [Aspergillus alliaceus]KAB8233917.1 hypothetical protein BDW43DRAFT_310593 [Aspergillus alliaceus]
MAGNQNPGNLLQPPSRGGAKHCSQGWRGQSQQRRDIASKGGQASGGSFEPGDPRAREAGRKGGSATSAGKPEE